jgi:hypothetical protein
MKVQTRADFEFLPIVPIDDDTRAMLAYAASPEGHSHIEQARQNCKKARASSSHLDTLMK